jgi:hypothetical protein
MDEDTEDEHEITHREAETIMQMVTDGCELFWANTELKYDSDLNLVRSDIPRVRPRTWHDYSSKGMFRNANKSGE